MALPAFGSLSQKKPARISDEEFKDLRDFIYDLAGIDIPLRRKYLLENRLGSRLEELKLKSFSEYARFLRSAPNRQQEIDKLCEKITTNETSFFRDTKQLAVFRMHVLAEVLKKQQEAGKKELNIWSAGCSSGEEPYTLAMILLETLGMQVIGWRIRITANDLSPAMLAKARRGIYNEHTLRTTPPEMIKKYFTQESGGYKIHPKVQKMVTFGPINLNDKMAMGRVPKSHIVFCRNVIIYFDDDMKKRVIQGFYDNLLDDGHLVLGHSENIHKLGTAFKPVIKPGGIVYQKTDKAVGAAATPRPGLARPGSTATGAARPGATGTGTATKPGLTRSGTTRPATSTIGKKTGLSGTSGTSGNGASRPASTTPRKPFDPKGKA